MRHFPASCPDCRRLWLVSTAQAPSASPECPRCAERGRLVPGAYYSDPGALIFTQLEEAVHAAQLATTALHELCIELEGVLPSPIEPELDAAFAMAMSRLKLPADLDVKAVGKRVALRMLVTIAGTLSQPVIRESGVMRLPQTIPGLFDLIPKKKAPGEQTRADAMLELDRKKDGEA